MLLLLGGYLAVGLALYAITEQMAISNGDNIPWRQRLLVVLIWFFYLGILIRAYINPSYKGKNDGR